MATGRQTIINRCVHRLKDVKPITSTAIWVEIKTLPKDSKELDYYRYMSVSPAAQRRIINDIRRGIEEQQRSDGFGMDVAVNEVRMAAYKLLEILNGLTRK